MRLDGRVVLVTGAGSGMGAAISKLFGREGASVALLDLNLDAARREAAEVERSVAVGADVGDSAAVDRAFAGAAEALGPIDIVVHAAGVDDMRTKTDLATRPPGPTTFAMDMPDDQWHEQIRVNLDGTFFVVRAALRSMVPRRRGSIVTIASVGGITGCFMVNYSAAKGGVLAFTRAVAQEAWAHGVRINAIAPGYIDTPMLSRNPLVTAPPALAGRYGRPDEVASAALFLATDDSSFVTGETLIVSGPMLTI
jgi:3-oxoacyl-[acyl-carrier protein] reductase